MSRLADRITHEVGDARTVLLGAGVPATAASMLADRVDLHSDTGIHAYRSAAGAELDVHCIDGTGAGVAPRPGGWVSDMVHAFAVVRRGRLDVAILGAFQVDRSGQFASLSAPNARTLGGGGAIDHARDARKLIIAMRLGDGRRRKLVERLEYPATTSRPADVVVTEACVLHLQQGRLQITDQDEDFAAIAKTMGLRLEHWLSEGGG